MKLFIYSQDRLFWWVYEKRWQGDHRTTTNNMIKIKIRATVVRKRGTQRLELSKNLAENEN